MSVSVNLNNTERVMYQGNNHVKCIYGPNNQLLWSEEPYFTIESVNATQLTFLLNGTNGTAATFYYWVNTVPNAARDNYTGTVTTANPANTISGLSAGDIIRLYRPETTTLSGDESEWNTRIGANNSINVYGDMSSLIGFSDIMPDYCFRYMFYNAPIVDASGLILPWNTISYRGCMRLFQGNSRTTAPPILPAANLNIQCYQWMFNACTSLENAALMYAKTIDKNSCYQMFNNCSSLNNVICFADTFQSNSFSNWLNGTAKWSKWYSKRLDSNRRIKLYKNIAIT